MYMCVRVCLCVWIGVRDSLWGSVFPLLPYGLWMLTKVIDWGLHTEPLASRGFIFKNVFFFFFLLECWGLNQGLQARWELSHCDVSLSRGSRESILLFNFFSVCFFFWEREREHSSEDGVIDRDWLIDWAEGIWPRTVVPSWLWTCGSYWSCLSCAGIIGVCHHTQLHRHILFIHVF